MNTNSIIRVQRIGNYFVPTDSQSATRLTDVILANGFDLQAFDLITPKIVKRGYALVVDNYGDGKPVKTHSAPMPY